MGYVTVTGDGVNLPWTTLKKTADEGRVNTTTLTNDAILQFSMAANKSYAIRLKVYTYSEANCDFKYGVIAPASPTSVYIERRMLYESGTPASVGEVAYPTDQALTGNGGVGFVHMEMRVTNVNAGVFAFQFAQNALHPSEGAYVLKGSYLEYMEF